MNNIEENKWWLPGYFFSTDFYLKGDHSKKGFSTIIPLSLKERTEREIKFIIDFLQPKDGSTMLDCPCGYGRHLIELAKLGYNITGVEINEQFIDLGNNSILEFNLGEIAKIKNQDMRHLDFPPNSFDYILNIFTSFGFFEDDEENEKVIDNFARLIKPEGKLLLYFDYNATRIINHKYFRGDESKYRKCIYNGITYDLWIDEEYDKNSKRLRGTWTLRNGGGPIEKGYSIRIYSNDEIRKLLYFKGFKDVSFFDPISDIFSDDSTETIIVATK